MELTLVWRGFNDNLRAQCEPRLSRRSRPRQLDLVLTTAAVSAQAQRAKTWHGADRMLPSLAPQLTALLV